MEEKNKHNEKHKRVCLRLREARIERAVSLTELSKKTKINKEHLIALEECRFDDLPFANIYKKNFIKTYCKALNICGDDCCKQFNDEEIIKTSYIPPKNKKTHTTSILHNLPIFLRFGILMGIASIFIGYLGLQVKNILEPPQLTIYTPEEGFITDTNTVIVQGKTEKESEVLINGTNIKHNDDGRFKEAIDVSDGVNTITITSKKKHGKITSDTRHIIVRKEENTN